MSDFTFGKTINFEFTPLINGTPTDAYQLVSSRLYADAPSNSEVDLTTSGDAIQTVTSWSGLGDSVYRITFSGVSDSEPHSIDPYATYYVATNFKWESGGATVFAEEVIHLFRPDAWTSRVSVSVADLTELENKFSNEFDTDAKIEAHIEHGKDTVFRELKARGFDKKRLFRLGDSLNQVVLYYALSSACRDLASDDSTQWAEKSKFYREQAERILDTAPIGYDTAGSDTPSPADTSNAGIIYVTR